MRRGSATRLDAKHHGSVSSGTEGSTRSSSAQSKGPGVEHKRRATRSCNAPPQVWLAKGRSGDWREHRDAPRAGSRCPAGYERITRPALMLHA